MRPGWVVKDGTLACVDPHDAGDLVTKDKFSWFDLELDYNISVAGNSGIMYHVTDAGRKVWETGPEFQLEDNEKAEDPVRCGWLYALYKPPIDPKTGKTLDATKPVGQWNHVRLVLTPEKCEHYINGVKYFEYVLGSDDFKARVAKSKFFWMKDFAKSDTGYSWPCREITAGSPSATSKSTRSRRSNKRAEKGAEKHCHVRVCVSDNVHDERNYFTVVFCELDV